MQDSSLNPTRVHSGENRIPESETSADITRSVRDSSSLFPADSVFAVSNRERRKFLLTGSAHMNFTAAGNKYNSFGFQIGWLPVFLWKPSPKLFFEGHLHIGAGTGKTSSGNAAGAPPASGHSHGQASSFALLNGGSTSTSPAAPVSSSSSSGSYIALAYSNLVYFLHPNVAVTAGIFLSPFGIYAERLHAEWINKLPDAPLGMDGTIPETEMGAQVRGGFFLQKLKMNYSFYISNGPVLTDSGYYAGKLTLNSLADNNSNKALGGRIGILPSSTHAFEAGFSLQHGKAGNENTPHAGVDAWLYAGDISFRHFFNFLRGTLELKAQYSLITADNVYYKADPLLTLSVPAQDVNLSDSTYRFDNRSRLYYVTASYRPVSSSKKILKNTEFVFRYDALHLPCYAIWNEDKKRWTAGIAYWLTSRSAVKYSYQSVLNSKKENYIVIQWVMGL
jgi:hypothetical protein